MASNSGNSKSRLLRSEDHRWIHHVSHECRDQGADPIAWRLHLASSLSKWIGSELNIIVELANRPDGVPYEKGAVEWGWTQGLNREGWVFAQQQFQDNPRYSPTLNAYFERLIGKESATFSRADLLSPDEYDRSVDRLQVNNTVGVDHIAYSFQACPETGTYTGMICGRAVGERDYTQRQKAVMAELSLTIGSMVGTRLAAFGMPSASELAPRERQVLECLLEGEGDKTIASRLNISIHTVNQYLKAIYLNYRVRSRAELLAYFLKMNRRQTTVH